MGKEHELTKEFVKKYIRYGTFYREACLQGYKNVARLSTLQAKEEMEKFERENKVFIEEEKSKQLNNKSQGNYKEENSSHYLLWFISEYVVIFLFFFYTLNDEMDSFISVISVALFFTVILYFFTLILLGNPDNSSMVKNSNVSIPKTTPKKSKPKKIECCPKCGSTNIFLYDDAPGGYDAIYNWYTFNPMDRIYYKKRKKKVISKKKVAAALMTGGASIPFTKGVKKKVSSEWMCKDCNYHWYRK